MATPVSSTVTQSALDFQGLGQLRGQAAQDGNKAIRETAQQFESMFIEMMMKSMRESVEKSDLNESSAEDTFQGMFDKEVSVQLAKKNTMGLADMLVKNLEQQQANVATTADMLKQRQDTAAFNAAAKGIALNPKAAGISLDKLNPKAAGIALPQAPKFELNMPAKPLNGSGS